MYRVTAGNGAGMSKTHVLIHTYLLRSIYYYLLSATCTLDDAYALIM